MREVRLMSMRDIEAMALVLLEEHQEHERQAQLAKRRQAGRT